MSEVIQLDGKLDLSRVTQLCADLSAQKDGPWTVDMAEVTQIGALCLQALIGAGKEARMQDRQLILRNTSDRVLSQLSIMGVTPEIIMEGRDEP